MNYSSVIAALLATNAPTNYPSYRAVSIVFMVLMFVAALAAVVLVMLQPGNSQGIDALGGSSETFYGKNKGRSTESMLRRWTVVCLVVLGVLAVLFFIIMVLYADVIWAK